jgi:hypothetical protein
MHDLWISGRRLNKSSVQVLITEDRHLQILPALLAQVV